MRSIGIILLLFFNRPVFSQSITEAHIFNDTSLYFIWQIDSLNPVSLSATELSEMEKFLKNAVNEFNQSQQRYVDSVNPGKKRGARALRIDMNNYFFKLVPKLNEHNQKVVWIDGDCKDHFKNRTGGKVGYDPDWKRRFTDGQSVFDGGACYIFLYVNLTLKNHTNLGMNSSG